ISELLQNPNLLATYRENARRHGGSMCWSNVGKRHYNLLGEMVLQHKPLYNRAQFMKTLTRTNALLLDECKADNPELNLTHLQRLTNHVGIVQHAKFAIPDYNHGYCLDDNSRALMVCGLASTIEPLRYDDLIDRYLAFIWYMQR